MTPDERKESQQMIELRRRAALAPAIELYLDAKDAERWQYEKAIMKAKGQQ